MGNLMKSPQRHDIEVELVTRGRLAGHDAAVLAPTRVDGVIGQQSGTAPCGLAAAYS
jgi:hypothetical protein